MILIRLYFLLILFVITQAVQAEETDQFTLPPEELLDIGPIASSRLYEVIEHVISQTNSEINMLNSRVKNSKHAVKQIKLRLKGTYIADAVYDKTGPGFPRWLPRGKLANETKPMIFKENRPWKTVYWLAFSQSPFSLIGLAPTIRMYDYYFGTDKLGHFFMQGHTYYKLYNFYRAHGKSAEQAHSALVTYGQILEHTYLGVLVNGVYSNGDLSANYAGWKFYTNLTQPVKIGAEVIPPILILNDNQWQFSRHVTKEHLLKPYLSDNLNEAYNPCRYTFTRDQIRKQVIKRCNEWIERIGITPKIVTAKLEESKKWHGENYGHWLPENSAVTLNACFGGK
ncbi:MAG TPA: hypothetical protein PK657_11030 [Legionella sp.]|nr:hypothetical protein [Legionella sp.]